MSRRSGTHSWERFPQVCGSWRSSGTCSVDRPGAARNSPKKGASAARKLAGAHGLGLGRTDTQTHIRERLCCGLQPSLERASAVDSFGAAPVAQRERSAPVRAPPRATGGSFKAYGLPHFSPLELRRAESLCLAPHHLQRLRPSASAPEGTVAQRLALRVARRIRRGVLARRSIRRDVFAEALQDDERSSVAGRGR